MIKKYNKMINIYVVTAVILLILCYMFPYSGDDWTWGSSVGIERLNSWFENYNGRYVGNLMVLVMTRSRILRAILMTVFLMAISIMVNYMTGMKTEGLLLILCLLIFMPISIFRQSIVWTSGFTNYTISISCFLIYACYVGRLFEKKDENHSIKACFPLFLLGVVSTLIVEHVTLCCVLLGISAILFVLVKYKKLYIQYVSYFLGAVVGAVYMFSNSAYRSVADGNDMYKYRSIGSEQGFIVKAVNSFTDIIMKEGFLNNLILNCIICAVCIIIWRISKPKLERKKRTVGKLSIAVITVYTQISVFNALGNLTQVKIMNYVVAVCTVFYALSLFLFILVLPMELPNKEKAVFFLLCAYCFMAPLLFVSPVSSRCFMASYVMFLCVPLYLMDVYGMTTRLNEKCISCVLLGGTMCLLFIFALNFNCDNVRTAKAQRDAKSRHKIKVVDLPYSNYVQYPNPTEGTTWEERFKIYYGIDENIKIKNKKYDK